MGSYPVPWLNDHVQVVVGELAIVYGVFFSDSYNYSYNNVVE